MLATTRWRDAASPELAKRRKNNIVRWRKKPKKGNSQSRLEESKKKRKKIPDQRSEESKGRKFPIKIGRKQKKERKIFDRK